MLQICLKQEFVFYLIITKSWDIMRKKAGDIMAGFPCEHCSYYGYDEEYDEYFCNINLDEDEMQRYMSGSMESCHYFSPYDEYKMVQKQN